MIVRIHLKNMEDVQRFLTVTNMMEDDLDIVCGRNTVDAKSMMGIFSLDLSMPMELNIHEKVKEQDLLDRLEPFLV